MKRCEYDEESGRGVTIRVADRRHTYGTPYNRLRVMRMQGVAMGCCEVPCQCENPCRHAAPRALTHELGDHNHRFATSKGGPTHVPAAVEPATPGSSPPRHPLWPRKSPGGANVAMRD